MGQTWENLLFAHWRVPEEALRRVVPEAVPLDRFDGDCWIGVTPFRVAGLRFRGLPPLPLVSSFPEINVRTYATVDGKPGIWFLSLDAASRLAVRAARFAYRLPYFTSRMRFDGRSFESERVSHDGPAAAFAATYEPTGAAAPPRPGSFDHWATERYCLYTLDEEHNLLRGGIHHAPWPLRPASAAIAHNTMAAPYGIELSGPPLLHFAHRQDVVFWRLRAAD